MSLPWLHARRSMASDPFLVVLSGLRLLLLMLLLARSCCFVDCWWWWSCAGELVVVMIWCYSVLLLLPYWRAAISDIV